MQERPPIVKTPYSSRFLLAKSGCYSIITLRVLLVEKKNHHNWHLGRLEDFTLRRASLTNMLLGDESLELTAVPLSCLGMSIIDLAMCKTTAHLMMIQSFGNIYRVHHSLEYVVLCCTYEVVYSKYGIVTYIILRRGIILPARLSCTATKDGEIFQGKANHTFTPLGHATPAINPMA